MDNLPPETNINMDVPDERDWHYELVFGVDGQPVQFPRSKLVVNNQWIDPFLWMSCSRQGIDHIVSAQHILLDLPKKYTIDQIWRMAVSDKPEIESQWDTLQAGLKQAKNLGIIAGFQQISTVEEYKQAVDRGWYVYTWSMNGNWNKVRDEKIYGIRENGSVGHIFAKFTYDDKGMIDLNSYGAENGYFLFPWELFDTTFTKYAIIPIQDIDAILLYKKRIMENITIESARTAFTNWIWNGLDPQKAASREEVAAMIQRAMEKIGK